ncbi:acyl-CoA thioesterase [Saccharopolyspora rhizosphaerae]|uniref:Acyl-CoA thioesterase n=1 Tax=Saccharopolyspora rhizosphaerae TaxID=2492662 RepID=A0A3R8Q1T6_9PSEU|nr:acyl-CoA thioesterase [Saccharopolyspora rhizosphaerae]RRO16722.1 acyl-CoA thioesterase [Saccharopolyspora rhizosphaerae]
MTFRIPIQVRSYELDALGHVNHAVYHQYGEVARVAGFRAAGCDWNELGEKKLAPVLLSTTVNFRRELRADEHVEASCEAKFGSGKSFHLDTVLTKADGTISADITCVLGLMDLDARKLVADPKAALEAVGFDAAVLAPGS